jgi:hypothetical protein
MENNFTKKQYLTLMKLVYLGNWLANSHRLSDDQIKEYEEMEDYIFSFAKDFGYERYVDHEEKDGARYYPTSYFEEETDIQKLIDEDSEENFWQEAIDHFGNRDFLKKYSREEIEKMDQKERFMKIMECQDKYEKEFNDNGINRFEIKE